MAWLERRGNRFRIKFRHGGRNHQVPLKEADAKEAAACLSRLEENLRLVERGRLSLPPDADLGLFLLSDGKLDRPSAHAKPLTLADLLALYRTNHPPGAKEVNTRKVEEIHFRHLSRLIGARTLLGEATGSVLQTYVERRCRENYRGRPINVRTVRKELGTLQTVWNWAHRRGELLRPCPTRGLAYPKTSEKPPFRTYDQIAAIVSRGKLGKQEARAHWDGLFLDAGQVDEVLEFVRTTSESLWLYPFLVAAARTGARRSELLRARVEDFDFGLKTVLVREKKKSKERDTFRTVDMTPILERVMKNYFSSVHPGGEFAFSIVAGKPVSTHSVNKCFRSAFRAGKWQVLRGFHVFRHSFASLLAASGVDPRVIDDLMGHQTPEMRNRYRHLFPDQRRKAVQQVFG